MAVSAIVEVSTVLSFGKIARYKLAEMQPRRMIHVERTLPLETLPNSSVDYVARVLARLNIDFRNEPIFVPQASG